jgi:nucleoside-diphosphate-sugar epimerase
MLLMKVLVTGHRGYIGAVMVPMLVEAGHQVVGLDSDLYRGCDFTPAGGLLRVPALQRDLRDIALEDVAGFDAVVHLAALSNDPLGDLAPSHTYDINLHASVRLAELAKQAGVSRFLYSSSCSVYGAAGEAVLDEDASFNPVTPYGESKIQVELALRALADETFHPTYFRNATAYGVSPRLRMDLVLNDLVANAVETGKVVVKSDGTPWRPLVHIRDISAAFVSVLAAPAAPVANQAFNIGSTAENYQVRDLAEMVAARVPGSRVDYAPGGQPDKRSYRVNFDRVRAAVPGFVPAWTVARGIDELIAAFRASPTPVMGDERFIRLRTIRRHLESGDLDHALRWRELVPVSGAGG